jgi:hypothetical protein
MLGSLHKQCQIELVTVATLAPVQAPTECNWKNGKVVRGSSASIPHQIPCAMSRAGCGNGHVVHTCTTAMPMRCYPVPRGLRWEQGLKNKKKNKKKPFPQGTAALDFFFSFSAFPCRARHRPMVRATRPAAPMRAHHQAPMLSKATPVEPGALTGSVLTAAPQPTGRPPAMGWCGQGPAFPFGSLSVQHEVAHWMETSVPPGQGTQTGRWLPHTAQDPYTVWVGPHPGLSATPASAGSAAVPVEAGCGSAGIPPTPNPQPGKVMVPAAAMSGHGLPPTHSVGGADPAAPPHHPHHHHAHWTQQGVPTWPQAGLPGVDAGARVAACPTPQSTAHILEQHTDHGGLHPPPGPVYVAAPAPVVEPSAPWQGGWQRAPPSYLGGWAQASGGSGRHALPPGVGWALGPQTPSWHHFGSLDAAGSRSNWPPGPGAQPGWLSGPGPRVPPTPPQQGFPAPHAWAAPPGSGPGWHCQWVKDRQPQVKSNTILPCPFGFRWWTSGWWSTSCLTSRGVVCCVRGPSQDWPPLQGHPSSWGDPYDRWPAGTSGASGDGGGPSLIRLQPVFGTSATARQARRALSFPRLWPAGCPCGPRGPGLQGRTESRVANNLAAVWTVEGCARLGRATAAPGGAPQNVGGLVLASKEHPGPCHPGPT